MNFNDVAIVFIKGTEYKIHFWYISKDDGIIITKSSNLNKKKLIIIFFFYKNE